jgi:Flp pilus assembly protein TadD
MIPLALACANKGIGSGVDPSPSWSSPGGRAQAKIELAEALVLNGTPEAALQMISQMVEQGIRHPDLYVLQGRALADMGLDHEAEVALSIAARRSPGNADAHNRLGILYFDQSRTAEAVKRFKAAARKAPTNAEVHNNYGFALMASGQTEEAVVVLRKALMLDGSQQRTRNNLGFALAVTGKDKAAWKVFKAGTDEASARYNLALAQEMRGDKAAAISNYELVLAADSTLTAASEALARLTTAEPKGVESTPEEH